MIIHSPKITGSLAFPREDGTEVVLQISTGGELETIEKDTSGNQTSTKPSTNLSGSFTGSFLGDGSNLTGVAATSLNIDGFSAGTLAGDDEVLFSDTSDSGNEKRATFVSGINAIGLFSGSSQLTSSFDLRYLEINGDSVVSGSSQIINLVGVDEDNMNSNSNTKFPTQQSVKAYVDSQILTKDNTDEITEGSSNLYFTNERVDDRVNALIVGGTGITATYNDSAGTLTLDGSAQYGDSDVTDHLDSLSVISGSASQVRTLLNVENGSTADQTGAEIKTALFSEDDTNNLTNTLKSKLDGIESSATADQTGAEIKTALFSESDTNNLTNTLKSKLDGIEGGADVTDAGNVVPILNSNTVISGSSQVSIGSTTGTLAVNRGGTGATTAGAARTALGVDAAGTDNSTDVTLGNTNYLSLSGQEITGGTVPVGSGGTGATTAGAARTALGVDAAGTDNSTNVTLENTNYLSISGQEITGGTVPIGSGGTGATTAGAARTALGVDAAGTDNSTDVTLAGSYDYISISGQVITRNQVDASTDISNLSTSNVSEGTNKYYTDAKVKTKITADSVVSGSASEVRSFLNISSGATNYSDSDVTDHLDSLSVLSGSITSADITDVAAFSQSGTYASLRAQGTTKGDVGLGNVTNESKSTMFASPTFTGTVAGVTATHVGLGNVTNESKSTMFASPTFTGTTVAPTPTADDNSTKIATTAYVQTELTALVGNAPAAMDTLGEISASLAADEGALDSLTTVVSGKLQKNQNLSDLSDAATARTNLGVDPAGTVNYTLPTNLAGDDIDIGGTALTGATVISDVDINITTNTSGLVTDANGSISTRTLTASNLGLGNVTNESKSTMFASPTFTGTVAGVTATHVGLGNVTNESKSTMFASPTFTGTVAGVTSTHVGLGNVENTALSTYTGNGGALDNQYIANGAGYITSFTNTNQLTTFQVEDGDGTEVTISHGKEWKFVEGTGIDINWTDTSSGTDGDPYDLTITNTAPFTGDVFDEDGTYTSLRAQGTTKGDVGLGNVTNESKSTMFASPTFTGTVAGVTSTHVGLGNVENTALSTYTGNGGALDNQYIANGANYISSFDITSQTDSKYLRSNATDTASGIITFSNSTASTSKTTGAVIVTGGVGISGALNVGGDVVAYASSDERLKNNIELISNPIEKVQSLKGVTWDWNENADELQQSLPNVGVIAQDVEKILPQLVTDRDNGFKGVDYAKLTGLLIEAIKEQQKQIDELKSKIG
jgi:hypothetical protein